MKGLTRVSTKSKPGANNAPIFVLDPKNRVSACRVRPAFSAIVALTGAIIFSKTIVTANAQEIRRALPADEPPTAPAAPFFNESPPPAIPVETPIPRAHPVTPATPTTPAAPQTSQPTISDETGPRSAPTPNDATASSEESQDQIQLEFATGFYARKLYDLAAPEYEKYLGIYQGAPALDRESATFRLAECYRILGNKNAAKNTYEALLSNFMAGDFVGPAAYRLADMYYADKEFASALTYYRKASVRVKDPAVVLAAKYYSARCLENLRSPAEARVVYEDIVSTKGENPFRDASRLALAQILTNFNRKDEAQKQYDALAKETQKPEVKAEALVKSGLLKIEANQGDKGAADLTAALKIPEIGKLKPVAEIGLLRVLYETGKYKQLVDTYQPALEDLPAESKPEVLLLAANSQRQLNNHKAARELYEQVLHEYPDSVYAKEARYERLVSLYNANDPEVTKAVDEFLASNDEPEKRDQVTLMKAEALFKQKQYADAAPVYASLQNSATLPLNMKAEAQFKLGWCFMQNKEPEKAITAFSDFLAENPLHKLAPTALAQRAVAYQQTKNFTAALKDFNQLLEHYPRAKERELALQQKALILGQQQDNAAMAETFKQLLKEFPKSSAAAQANYWIGWAAFEAKDYKSAIEPLEAARKLDKTQFFEKATLRILLSHYYLEERDALATEVDASMKQSPKTKVPTEVLRWLGEAFLTDKNYENAEKYLLLLTKREDDLKPDDWLNLGRAQLGENKFADAVKTLGLYLDGRTDVASRATGLLELGNAQLGLAEYDNAQKSADEICTLQPEGRPNAEGRMLSGDIAFAREKFNDASKIYQSIAVILDDPQITPRALEKAYAALLKAGSTTEAQRVLNELQTKYPEYQIQTGQQ